MRHVLLSAVHTVILVAVLPALAAKPMPVSGPPELEAWVLVRAGSSSVHMSGSTRDIKRARALQQKGESLLYVRRAGKAYVIKDAALLGKLDGIWAPAEEVGKKMDALGKKMDPLGKKMDALGKRMDRAHDDQERDAVSRQMDELGQQMDVLGQQMDVLGREMDRVSKKAEADLGVLVDEAIKGGKAVEVKAPL